MSNCEGNVGLKFKLLQLCKLLQLRRYVADDRNRKDTSVFLTSLLSSISCSLT